MATGIGILGAARITQKAIIEPAKVIPQARLAVMAAREQARAEAYATQHAVRDVVATYDDVIASDAVDLIYNPLPINLHADWSIKALAAGKHVLCEKPFAMNAVEADAMLAAARQSGLRLIEAFHYRYHPAFQTCLDWLAADEIGELRAIQATFNVGIKDNGTEIRHRVETGGGAMMDLGCYPLHWALSIVGETPDAITATATLTPAGVDESMSAELAFASGVTARLTASMQVEEPFRAEMTLIGSKGEISFVNPLAPHHELAPGRLTTAAGRVAKISPISTYTWQLAAVLQALASGDSLPTEGEMILRQQQALDAIYDAAGLRHLRYL
ncbi:MAG: Gfo/Idh/MocA family oxidoreductase [Pseudomonadota bacterium]|nr:Gfo/Idh/MocA family oxidoreductase [Pseudomonadota bacterium]